MLYRTWKTSNKPLSFESARFCNTAWHAQEAAGLRIKVERAAELVSVAVAEKREAEAARGQLEARITRSREGAALVRRARLQSQLDACRAALSDARSALQSQVGGLVYRAELFFSCTNLLAGLLYPCYAPHISISISTVPCHSHIIALRRHALYYAAQHSCTVYYCTATLVTPRPVIECGGGGASLGRPKPPL